VWLRELLRVDDLLRPALLVTWAVPAARVRPQIPAPLVLETVPDPAGDPLALLTVAAVLNVGAHPRLLPRLRTTCAQANYRTYVRAPGARSTPSVYFFANFVGGRAGWVLPWLLSARVVYAPARMAGRVPAAPGATWHVRLAMRSPLGPTLLDAAGPCRPPTDPLFWADAPAGARFLTQRLTGYLADRLGGISAVPVDHVEMAPWTGEVRTAVCAPWQHWGLLTPAEVQRPLTVFAQPQVLFRAYLPHRL